MDPEQLTAVGRDVECVALARAVKWHAEHRILLNGHKTVVFVSGSGFLPAAGAAHRNGCPLRNPRQPARDRDTSLLIGDHTFPRFPASRTACKARP
jgi:hypothetical protein